MRSLTIIMAFLSIFGTTKIGDTAVVYSSFSGSPTYTADWQIKNPVSPQVPPGSDMAGKFSFTGADYFLDSIEMYIKDVNNVTTDFISLWIAENDALNNVPSSTIVLSKTNFNVDIPNSYTRVMFDPVESPILTAGTDYWLIASVADGNTVPLFYTWNSNSSLPPPSGQLASRELPGDWQNINYYPLAYQVNGTEVPLPGAIWLFGTGFIGLIGLRKKLRK